MDKVRARMTLNRDLEALAARRRRTQADVNELGLKIGATTTYLRDYLDQSKASSAAKVGLSASHLTELMAKAAEANTRIDDPLRRVPRVGGRDLQEFVIDHDGITRIVASFADFDVLYMSELSPAQLLEGSFLTRPHMALQAGDGEWVIVDNVNVGYGGTGPTNALGVLTGLGLNRELAWNIAYHRVSDVHLADLEATEAVHSNTWPRMRLGEPLVMGNHFVVPVDADGQGQDMPDAPTGVDSSGEASEQQTHLQRWLDVLDRDMPPEWMRGSRRARVYLDRSAAEADGFMGGGAWSRGGRGPYSVILEQGDLQLWLNLPESNDPSQLFTPETYVVLRAAGFYVDDLESRDARGAFWRWLSTLGRTRPAFVDLDGKALRHPLPVDLPIGHR